MSANQAARRAPAEPLGEIGVREELAPEGDDVRAPLRDPRFGGVLIEATGDDEGGAQPVSLDDLMIAGGPVRCRSKIS